jgi:uncharacterized membrane protein
VPVVVSVDIVIDRPRRDVAAFAADPDNASVWYGHITDVRWKTPRPLAVGSRLCFISQCLGKPVDSVYEVTALVPGERLAMRTGEGPYPVETMYAWEDAPGGRTKMSLRSQGDPRGFTLVGALLLRRAMRRSSQKDLRRLKSVLEGPAIVDAPPAAAGRGQAARDSR